MLIDTSVKFVQQVNSIVLSPKNALAAQMDSTSTRKPKNVYQCVKMGKSTTHKLKSVNVLKICLIIMVVHVLAAQDNPSGAKMP